MLGNPAKIPKLPYKIPLTFLYSGLWIVSNNETTNTTTQALQIMVS